MVERLLIDANSIGHAAHQGTTLKAGDQQTQAVYNSLQSMRKYRMRHPNATILMLWDGDSWRKKQSTVYKNNRVDTPEKAESRRLYKTQLPFIRKALQHLAIPQLIARNFEADDLAAIMSRRYISKGDTVRLISGDRDWWQLLQPGCIWEDHRDESKKVTHKTLEVVSAYQSKPSGVVTPGVSDVRKYLEAKCLHGDISDNLPGVGGIGEKGALDLIHTWGSVSWFLADPNREQTFMDKNGKKIPKAFLDFASDTKRHEIFAHNLHLMSLLDEPPIVEKLVLNKGEFNPDAFKSICHELSFTSIYRPEAFDGWVEPFKTKN